LTDILKIHRVRYPDFSRGFNFRSRSRASVESREDPQLARAGVDTVIGSIFDVLTIELVLVQNRICRECCYYFCAPFWGSFTAPPSSPKRGTRVNRTSWLCTKWCCIRFGAAKVFPNIIPTGDRQLLGPKYLVS